MIASQSGKKRATRRGRPPGHPDTARSERVVTFLTREQMKQLKIRADTRGLSISAVCAELLNGALGSLADETKVEPWNEK